MSRRKRHLPRIGVKNPERRKAVFDRRRHYGIFRIFYIPLDRLLNEFSLVTLF